MANGVWRDRLTDMMYLSDELYDLSYFDIDNPDTARTTDIRVHAAAKDTRALGTNSSGSISAGTTLFDVDLRVSKHVMPTGDSGAGSVPLQFVKYVSTVGHSEYKIYPIESDNNTNTIEYVQIRERIGGHVGLEMWPLNGHYYQGTEAKHTFYTARGGNNTAWLELYSLNGKLHLGMAVNYNGAYDWTDTMEYEVEITKGV